MLRPSSTPAGGLGDHELLARRLGLGLAVGLAADLDVEHVDLAVDGLLLAVGPEVHGGVRAALGALDALGDRAGDEVDAQLARGRRRPCERGAVERLGARCGLLGRAEHGPLLRQHDELGAGGGGGAGQPVGRARLRSRSAVEVSWTAAARTVALPSPRIDSSVNPRRSISSGHAGTRELEGPGRGRRRTARAAAAAGAHAGLARRAPAQALDVGRRVRARADAVRGASRAIGPATAAWWAVWDGGRAQQSARCAAGRA